MNVLNPQPFAPTFPVIFAAPSGAGKTSIARALGDRRDDVEFSVSATTRPPRLGERDGHDYHFHSDAEFRALVAADAFVEWAEVHGHLYGTPRANLVQAVRRRHFLLLDIDVQGSRQVKRSVPEAVSVFVLPPTGAALVQRLQGRGSEDDELQRRRLRAARDELRAAVEFDYVVVNDDLQRAVDSIEAILHVERMKTRRLDRLDDHITTLMRGIDDLLDGPKTPERR